MSFLTTQTDFKPLRAPDGEKIYFGLVEDNADPEQMGRCKIRIAELFGSSTSNDTDSLPWALMEQPPGCFKFDVPMKRTRVAVYFHRGDVYSPIYKANIVASPLVPDDFKTNYPDRHGWKDSDGNYLIVDKKSQFIELGDSVGNKLRLDKATKVAQFRHETGAVVELAATGLISVHSIGKISIADTSGSAFMEVEGAQVKVNGSAYTIARKETFFSWVAGFILGSYNTHQHIYMSPSGLTVTSPPVVPDPAVDPGDLSDSNTKVK